MTAYVNLRALTGAEPEILIGDGASTSVRVIAARNPEFARLIAGREVLLAIHGFNISYEAGLQVLARFERAIGLPGDALFLGVLWPGDFWIPVVNYPFEASVAVRCGGLLARFCDRWLGGAATGVSIVSHSLGGRVALEAARQSSTPIKTLCLTAAAVDRDSLTAQYPDAVEHCTRTYVLSSTRDMVLRYAYPAGDFLSDLFGDSDSPFRSALGLRGPRPNGGATVRPFPIPESFDCGHTDYLSAKPVAAKVGGYVARAFAGEDRPWP